MKFDDPAHKWVYVQSPLETVPRQCKRCGQLYIPELGHNCPGPNRTAADGAGQRRTDLTDTTISCIIG